MTTAPAPSSSRRRPTYAIALNILNGVLALVVLYLGYAFVTRQFIRPPVETSRTGSAGGPVIQVDILNGSGISGAAVKATSYLRARGYDVVEMRNYRSFDVKQSLVVDRTGVMEHAERVAYALGIPRRNIIQQINEQYYVDVSVVIGRDFPALKPSQ
jgi:hypothetical protein